MWGTSSSVTESIQAAGNRSGAAINSDRGSDRHSAEFLAAIGFRLFRQHRPIATTSRPFDYSGLMPPTRTPFPHSSVPAAMTPAKSVDEPGRSVPANVASRSRIFGSASDAFTSLLSLSMMNEGVLRGAPRPYQVVAA